MFEPEKLYQIKKYFWLLYPSKEIAATATAAASYSDYWSKKFNCNVSYVSPNTIFFPVEIDGEYVKVVSGEGIGWIINPENKDWTKGCIEEVNQ